MLFNYQKHTIFYPHQGYIFAPFTNRTHFVKLALYWYFDIQISTFTFKSLVMN